jgi:hypothetical protein
VAVEEQALEAPAAAERVGALAAVGASGAAPASPNASREPMNFVIFMLSHLLFVGYTFSFETLQFYREFPSFDARFYAVFIHWNCSLTIFGCMFADCFLARFFMLYLFPVLLYTVLHLYIHLIVTVGLLIFFIDESVSPTPSPCHKSDYFTSTIVT